MRQGIFLILGLLVSSVAVGQCCDQDSPFFQPGACFPSGEAQNFANGDGAACDPDCTDYNVCVPGSQCYNASDPSCPAIPIDGGLSLLALAGGGLATAAMRRRKEEEAAQKAV